MTKMIERQRDSWRTERQAAVDDAAERVRFQASLAEKLLHALLIAHGGAIIGLFTFIGNLVAPADGPVHVSIGFVWGAFACFVAGVALALASYIFAFMSQHHFYLQAVSEARRADRALLVDEVQIDRTEANALNAAGHWHYRTGLWVASTSVAFFLIGGALALLGLLPG